MSLRHRQYAVVDISGLASRAKRDLFDAVKSRGVIQNSFDTCRKSLDGTKMIVKWDASRHDVAPSLSGKIVFQGNDGAMWVYLQDNLKDWETPTGIELGRTAIVTVSVLKRVVGSPYVWGAIGVGAALLAYYLAG